MKIIIGLGNPGKEYANNRHNVGFMAVDLIAHKRDLEWREKTKFHAYVAEADDFILVKPTTFMNDSGRAVQAVAQFYKSDDILVIADDIDREFGSIRTRKGGGSGGHNGLGSIISHIGEDFARIRIGASNQHRELADASDFVLKDFSKEESDKLSDVLEEAIKLVDSFLDSSFEETTTTL